MRVYFQIIVNHAGEPSPTILLHCVGQKYMFNCSENFMRFQKQHRTKCIQGMNFLLTRISSETLDGLHPNVTNLFGTGMAIGNRIYGPQGTVSMFQAMKTKYYIKLLPFSVATIGSIKGGLPDQCLLGLRDLEEIYKLQNDTDFPLNYFESIPAANGFLTKKFADKMNIFNDAREGLNSEGNLVDKEVEIVAINVDEKHDIVAYLVKFAKGTPKISKSKLASSGIAGKQVKEIQQKGEIEINGKKIFLEEILEEEPDPVSVLIFDCVSVACIEGISKSPHLDTPLKGQHKIIAVIHMTSTEIVQLPEYDSFLKKFDENCMHIFASSGLADTIIDPQSSEFEHISATNYLASEFPQNYPQISALTREKKSLQTLFPFLKNTAVARQNYEFVISPVAQQKKYQPISQQVALKQSLNIQELSAASVETKKYLKDSLPSQKEFLSLQTTMKERTKEYDPEIYMLGTTCMMPTSFRNNSSILIYDRMNSSAIMLDCGEGTYYQMLNQFGEDQCAEVLRALKLLIITHSHSDHYLGFQGVIYQRQKAIEAALAEGKEDFSDLYLVLPWCLAPWFEALNSFSEHLECKVIYIQDFNDEPISSLFSEYKKDEFTDSELEKQYSEECKQSELTKEEAKCSSQAHHGHGKVCKSEDESDCQDEEEEESDNRSNKANIRAQQLLQFLEDGKAARKSYVDNFKQFLLDHVKILELKLIPVIHCSQAYGVVFTHAKSGIKISYSGDTRPCQLFAEAAKDSDLLIHEATFNDDLLEYAKKARHSSVSEALRIAQQANAKAVVLTHISKRHMKIKLPTCTDYENNYQDKFVHFRVAVALDHFSFKLSEFYLTPSIQKAANTLFPDYD